jgi:hypothetical protein
MDQHYSVYFMGFLCLGLLAVARAKTIGAWALGFLTEPLITK